MIIVAYSANRILFQKIQQLALFLRCATEHNNEENMNESLQREGAHRAVLLNFRGMFALCYR